MRSSQAHKHRFLHAGLMPPVQCDLHRFELPPPRYGPRCTSTQIFHITRPGAQVEVCSHSDALGCLWETCSSGNKRPCISLLQEGLESRSFPNILGSVTLRVQGLGAQVVPPKLTTWGRRNLHTSGRTRGAGGAFPGPRPGYPGARPPAGLEGGGLSRPRKSGSEPELPHPRGQPRVQEAVPPRPAAPFKPAAPAGAGAARGALPAPHAPALPSPLCQRFTDGITNKLVACYVEEDMRDCVLVRVYGERTELLVDRESEVRNFQLLRAHGCAPKLYCTFQNGLCYEYMRGVALGPEHIREPRLFRLIALEMAKIHTIHANGSLPKPTLWHKIHNYFALVKNEINPSLSVDVPEVGVLERELVWLKEHLPQLDSPVVFCHNDLLCKNIIYDSSKGHVRFIDYEYAGYNYQAFDIGNHFNEFAGVNEVDYSRYPARETQLLWLRYYLQAQKGTAVTPREVERLYVQVNKFALASHFLWALWALIQNQFSTIDFDFLRYAVIRFNQYFKVKPQVAALEMPK
ncbi:PREDICTED: ethanolamine kinase 2 [Bison bison bison]|uniref:ethanolamine kinase n=1 Tax=Bison bison bison TaxID=43346 RepID=A0A6P3IDC5_BISBB|nr:PREDICTED: ethanolamine kinase 2 [Bison bison bison]